MSVYFRFLSFAAVLLAGFSSVHGQWAPQEGRNGGRQPTEAPPAGKVKWIDVHNHLVVGRQGDYAGAVKAALGLMDQLGVEKMIFMSPPKMPNMPVDDLDQMAAALKKHPGRFAWLGGGESLNPMIQQNADQGKISDSLKRQFELKALGILKSGASGFGEMAVRHLSLHGEGHPYEDVPADHPLFLLLADIAAKHDVPIDIHLDLVTEEILTPEWLTSSQNPKRLKPNIEPFERLLSHNPKAKICWAHAGSDNTGHWTVDLSRRLLEKYPNLYMSLRMGPGMSGPQNFPLMRDGQVKPGWLSLFKDFQDRFVIGSDNFVAPASFQGQGVGAELASRIPATRKFIPVLLNALPPDLAQKIGCDNAIALYKLKK